ncbi:MAG TPA: hypothetical protein PKB02_10670 [Anaerohalosphaeraceae bacterium]|nr:hypothetical protein [Anaerohalosphaeraceae bacterium]
MTQQEKRNALKHYPKVLGMNEQQIRHEYTCHPMSYSGFKSAEDLIGTVREIKADQDTIVKTLTRPEYAGVVNTALAELWTPQQAKAAAFPIADAIFQTTQKKQTGELLLMQDRVYAASQQNNPPQAAQGGPGIRFAAAIDKFMAQGASKAKAISMAFNACSEAEYRAWIQLHQK